MIVALIVTACSGGGDGGGGGGGGGGSEPTARVTAPTTNTYTFELSGNGVTFSSDIHAYPDTNYNGNQTETDLTHVTLGAATNTYTITGKSFISNFTLNTGAGVLTIVTKKNGVVLRTDTINTNATGTSVAGTD